jgi:hypothetical protein
MLFVRWAKSFAVSFHNSGQVVKQGIKSLKGNPQVLGYPYLAVLFAAATLPLANGFVLRIWNKLAHNTILNVGIASHNFRIVLGLGIFSLFYTGFITAYFTCAVAAGVLAELEGRPIRLLYGLRVMFKRFFRISKFAILGLFLFPISLFAQRKKLLKKPLQVLGSSYSVHIPQLAPLIVTQNQSVLDTIRTSIKNHEPVWREGLILKLGVHSSFLVLLALGFLPKLIEERWFHGTTAQILGWLASVLFWALGYVTLRVIGAVFTTTLYHWAMTGMYMRMMEDRGPKA